MISRRCIVHIGPHKSGTTSIQRTLFTAFDHADAEYAKLGTANQGRRLHSIFAAAGRSLPWHAQRAMSQAAVADAVCEARQRLNAAVTQSRAGTIVFSGERISVMQPDELVALRDYLRRHFDRIDIVGYVRPPRGRLTSLYQEVIKNRFVAITPFSITHRYRAIFEPFDAVFGRENVHLFRFDPADFPDGDVVRHFFSAMELPPPERYCRINETLSKAAVQVLYAYQKRGTKLLPGRRYYAIHNAAVARLSGLRDRRFHISGAVLQPAIARTRGDIAWAEERLGASLCEPADDAAHSIRSESDMLDIAPEALSQVEDLVAAHAPLPPRCGDRAAYAAALYEALLNGIAATTSHRGTEMRRRRRRRKTSRTT